MPRKSSSIQKSKYKVDDEYYTLFDDIAKEVSLYAQYLKGKRILCPCDWFDTYDEKILYLDDIENPISTPSTNIKSQFVRFLLVQADTYGIKSLTCSGYNPKINKGVRFQNIDYSKYDVIITNPPFSQFAEFINILIENKKEFIVIGPLMGLSLVDIIDHIKNNEIWLGYHYHMSGFLRPDGTIMQKNESVCRCSQWYTNLPVDVRQRPLYLTGSYYANPNKYPQYVNYDAIEVGKVRDIPDDYYGEMGVPVSIMQSLNPDQFEVIGESSHLAAKFRDNNGKSCSGRFYTLLPDGSFKRHQARYIIKRKK